MNYDPSPWGLDRGVNDIEPHGVNFCNSNDTTTLKPSLEILERFKLEYLPLAKDLPEHASFIYNKRLHQVVGWEHKTSWLKHLK